MCQRHAVVVEPYVGLELERCRGSPGDVEGVIPAALLQHAEKDVETRPGSHGTLLFEEFSAVLKDSTQKL
jgi:hypothetical protein